jgi:hypothetical protein
MPPGNPPPPYGQPPSTPYGPPPYGPPPSAPYPPPPYPAQPPGFYPPPQQKTNWWAVVSLVFGIIGGVLISVVCGIVALTKAKQGQGGRGMAVAGLVLSGLWVVLLAVGIFVYLVIGRGTVTATSVEMGDCLKEIPDSARVLTVQTVGCDEPHAGEVFAVLEMPDGDFPGQPAIDEYADKCSPALASYSPAAMEDDSVQMYVLYPTAETWEQGDRAVTCIATLDPPRTGSIKG